MSHDHQREPDADPEAEQNDERPQPGRLSPFDAATEYSIIDSDTPRTEDGYKPGEPKRLECDHCSAGVLLTAEPSRGVDDLAHDVDCPQRFAHSQWYRSQL